MLPSNNAACNSNQQRDNDEDFRQQHYRIRPQMQMQNPVQPNVEQQRFERNRKHVQRHQSQPAPPPPFQTYYMNNSPQFQAPFRTGNYNSIYMPQYSSSIQSESAWGQRQFASNSPSEGLSMQTFPDRLGASSLASHIDLEKSAQVALRSADAPRRGRPPKNLSHTSSPKIQKSGIPKRRGRPPKDYTALANDTSPASLMERDQKSMNGKKPNSQSDDNPPKRRGRPPKQSTPEVEIQLPNPMYLIYKCEWKNCPAQLHNLATLRLHLFNIHGRRENGMSSCFWKGCNTAITTKDGDAVSSKSGIHTQYKFKDEDEWKGHIEKKHLTPYAWHMGDGPHISLGPTPEHDPSFLPAFLFDKNGVQVTPSVRNQQIEDGDPKRNSVQRFRRRLSGLDFVLDPIYNSEFESPIQARKSNDQENNEDHSSNEDEGDDEDADMDIDSNS